MLFGKVFNSYGNICRIEVYCKCDENGSKIVVSSLNVVSYVGLTKSVFVPNNHNYNLQTDDLVFFSIKENEMEKREGLDEYLLDDVYTRYRAFSVLKTIKPANRAMLNEKYSSVGIANDSRVYLRSNNQEIIGPLKAVKEKGKEGISLTPYTSGQTTLNIWNKEYASTLEIPGQGLFLINQPSESDAKKIDISTPVQLRNWFKKKINKHSKGEFSQAVKTLEPFIETADDILDDSLEKQKWENVRTIIERVEFDANEFLELLNTDILRDKFKKEINSFKNEIVESRKSEIDIKIKSDSDKLKQKYSIKEKEYKEELSQLKNLISEKEKQLKNTIAKAEKEEGKLAILSPIIDEFKNNKDEIIKQVTIFQTMLGGDTSFEPKTQEIQERQTEYIPNMVEDIEPCEFFKKVSIDLKSKNVKASIKKIILLDSALEVFRGVFVPNSQWSRAYCNANPGFHHFIISIDPSIKGIHGLTEKGFKAIIDLAIENIDAKFYIHFDCLNHSVADVWMKSVKNLVEFEEVRMPLDGFSMFPKNVYFFFSPSNSNHSYEITSTCLDLFPSIHHVEPDEFKKPVNYSDFDIKRLSFAIAERVNGEVEGSIPDAESLLYGYRVNYLTEED